MAERVVVVRGTDAPCAVAFTPVLTLSGQGETLPKPPIVSVPGARWLTATYTEGEVAFWSPSGELERLMGRGPGDGPGEFGTVSDLVVDSLAGEVHIFTSSAHVDVFSLGGEFLRRIQLPGPAIRGARLSDRTVATATSIRSGVPKIVLVRRDTAFAVGPSPRFIMPAQVQPGEEGVWSAEAPWYRIDHHALPSGQVEVSIRREVDWFPEPTQQEARAAAGPQFIGFTLDPEGRLVFARILQVEDPDAPEGTPRIGGNRGEDLEETNRRYFDGFLEVFSFDGRLVASSRFDSGLGVPRPIGGGSPRNLWYRLTDDPMRSIEVLRPELVEPASP